MKRIHKGYTRITKDVYEVKVWLEEQGEFEVVCSMDSLADARKKARELRRADPKCQSIVKRKRIPISE